VEGFPRFVGLWVLTAVTLVIAAAGVAVQLQQGRRTGAVLLGVYVVVMTAGVISVLLLRRRLR
jgi:predicted membrane channel-forming protein YqfA (hemolysin III family)